MDFKSEIRDSQIQKLITKVYKKSYDKYLASIELEKVRLFENQEISFDFPVTALVAPNGGGKTTVLGAAALAYTNVRPGRFFSKSGKLDDTMANWKIKYKLVDKSKNPKEIIEKTAVFKDVRWRRSQFLNRETIYSGLVRTVPAVERRELVRCASSNFSFNEDDISTISNEVADAVSKILGKDISKYRSVNVGQRGNVSILSGVNNKNEKFSEFHFGAGESSVIKLVSDIENADDNCLVLIEEIENGLHPIATIRLVEYLIEVAEKRNIQTIFTTHSDYALAPLPGEAIWASIDQKLYQGKLSIVALRELQYINSTKMIVYVEDEFAKQWMESVLRKLNFDLSIISIVYLGGDGNAVKMNKFNNLNPEQKAPSISVIDGDSREKESNQEKVYRLPGNEPELFIYKDILDNIDEIIVPLCYALGWDTNKQSELVKSMEVLLHTNREYHNLFSQLGLKLNYLSEDKVKTAFLNIWCDVLLDRHKDNFTFLEEWKNLCSNDLVGTN